MTVRRTQNSGIPAFSQEPVADIQDGTSNTVQSATSQSKPGSKDVFETSKDHAGLKAGASEVLYETVTVTARGEANGLKADSNEVAVEGFTARGEAKGMKESNDTESSFMDYTDDAVIKKHN